MTSLRRLVPLVLALAFVVAPRSAEAAHKIRFATLAPKNSSWGKVFKLWQKAVAKRSDGKLELEVYYNGVQGGEDGMVGKMKTGQLDGAALTSVGLSRIHRDVLVLQIPGLLDTWDLLDKARADLGPDLEKGFADAGFNVLGWGDVGLVHLMSKGFAVRVPSDLKGKSPVVWRDEPMGPMVFSAIGGVNPVPLGPIEVLPALRSGKVNVLSAPALAAEQLQWVANLDHIGANVSVCAVGGMVMRQAAIDGMPADLREVFLELQRKMGRKNADRIRKLDATSYLRLKKKMAVVELSDAEREEWHQLLKGVIERIAQGTFPKELVERVVKISGKS